jgi:hypothetical protein
MRIRSHIRSAALMSCVLNTMVVPARFTSSTASFSTWAFTGSRPENGSSRMRRSGRETTAAMNWIFCAMPFDSASILWCCQAVMPRRSSHASISRSTSPSDRPLSRP